jgi:hypothetical protein
MPMLLIYGGLPVLVGAIVAALVATTLRRTLALLALGAAAALIAYVVADARGAFEVDPQCSNECGLSALIAGLMIVGNVIGWTVGVLVGALVRRLARAPERREQPA